MNEKILSPMVLKHNIQYFSSFKKELVIMVKANAYGHGVKDIATILGENNVILGVATLDEARDLERFWQGRILIVQPLKKFENISSNFDFCVEDFSSFMVAKDMNLLENCYIKINTGMNRFGFHYEDKNLKKIGKLLKKIRFKGLMTHFSCVEDEKFTRLQYRRFQKAKKSFYNVEKISFGGTGVCKYDFEYNQLRVGIGFYGYENEKVLPIMKVKSQILDIHVLKIGESLGYGNQYIAKTKRKIGVVGIGYGDGIRRDLSGFYVEVNGQKCQIIGKICMDCMFVDITDVECREGDMVVFKNIQDMANYLNTIPYEILTSFSSLRGKTKFCDKS